MHPTNLLVSNDYVTVGGNLLIYSGDEPNKLDIFYTKVTGNVVMDSLDNGVGTNYRVFNSQFTGSFQINTRAQNDTFELVGNIFNILHDI